MGNGTHHDVVFRNETKTLFVAAATLAVTPEPDVSRACQR